MAFNLKNRSFLTLRDYTPKEIAFLLKLAADLKAAPRVPAGRRRAFSVRPGR
jgi:ornithine carbamoyltransferase